MKKTWLVLAGMAGFFLGTLAGLLLSGVENGSNNGNQYYGDVFAEAAKKQVKGMGSNNGNQFFGDEYIRVVLGRNAIEAHSFNERGLA